MISEKAKTHPHEFEDWQLAIALELAADHVKALATQIAAAQNHLAWLKTESERRGLTEGNRFGRLCP